LKRKKIVVKTFSLKRYWHISHTVGEGGRKKKKTDARKKKKVGTTIVLNVKEEKNGEHGTAKGSIGGKLISYPFSKLEYREGFFVTCSEREEKKAGAGELREINGKKKRQMLYDEIGRPAGMFNLKVRRGDTFLTKKS